jgi:multiple antibiotic resistance protein
MDPIQVFLLCFTPLFVIINPFGTIPVFLTLTEAFRKNRIRVALKVTLFAFAVLLVFGLFGLGFFNMLGVSINAFRIAGGLILLRVAFEMIKGETRSLHSSHYTEDDISVMPLAIPLLAGPGAISTMVVLTHDYPDQYVYAALIASMIITFAVLASSKWVLRVIKERGVRVMIRLFGIILTAEAVQMVITGVLNVITEYKG